MSDYMAELRDVNVQKDSMRFRRNIERIGELLAYEVSQHLSYAKEEVQTPLAIAHNYRLQDPVVIGTILRAGLPFHAGFLNYFDHAENACYRREYGTCLSRVALSWQAPTNTLCIRNS